MSVLLLAILPAYAALPPETDLPYSGSGTFTLGSYTVRLQGQQLIGPDSRLFVDNLYTPPVGNGKWLCAADEGDDGMGRLRCWDSQLKNYTIFVGGLPDRLALQDGHIAGVRSSGGLPQVFVASTDAREPIRPLTNINLDYTPGQAPAGFIAPPLGQSLYFEGDFLRWNTIEGSKAVICSSREPSWISVWRADALSQPETQKGSREEHIRCLLLI